MKSKNIAIKAGQKAIELIRNEGLQTNHVRTIAAAAGGPKWFVIYHLTKYIGTEILPKIEGCVDLIGSSIGAWQLACLACEDPSAALTRLRDNYAGEYYQFPITTEEVSRGCLSTLNKTFSEGDIAFVLNNKKIKLNVFAAKGRGLLNSNNKASIYAGLAMAFLGNTLSRKNLNGFFRRYIFSSHNEMPIIAEELQINTILKKLDSNNFNACLMGTAAIPLLMNGVDYVDGLNGEVFWDGGLTDYHMVLQYKPEGLVLIPHFLPHLTPGWLDKKLKYRRGKRIDLANVVMIHPSENYISSLPKQKISSRDDFMEFGEDQDGRAKYWTEVSERGIVLAEEFDELIKSGKIAEVVQPFPK